MVTIYFDTNVFRYFATAFHDSPIEVDLRDHFAISPISLLELLGQLAVPDAEDDAFRAIRTILKVFDPESIPVLPWVDAAIRVLVFDLPQAPTEMNALLCDVMTDVFKANSLADIRYVHDLRPQLDEAKTEAATRFCELLDSFRRDEHKQAFAERMALRASFPLALMNTDDVQSRLNALWTYISARLKNAAANKDYRPFSGDNKNDTFDAEQLVYLAHPDCHFLTADGRYRVASSAEQYPRIHVEPESTYRDRILATNLIRQIVQEKEKADVDERR